ASRLRARRRPWRLRSRRHRRVSLREELAHVASRPTAVAALQAELSARPRKRMACCTPACLFAPGVGWPGEYPGEAEHMGKFEETSRRLADTFSRHDLEGLANVYAADAVAYDPMYPEPLRGRAAIKKDAATFL